MNKTLKLSFIALLAGLCIMTKTCAEELSPCKIGIVDIKKVVANSSEAKSIQTEQKKKIDELTRFSEKARLSVDKEKDPEKQKELEEKFTKELNEKRTAIDSEYAKKLSLAEQDIRNIIETTAKDKGYTMVIMKSVVLYGGEDINDEVAKAVKSFFICIKKSFHLKINEQTSFQHILFCNQNSQNSHPLNGR